jgi:hypothetical protein
MLLQSLPQADHPACVEKQTGLAWLRQGFPTVSWLSVFLLDPLQPVCGRPYMKAWLPSKIN